MNDVFNINLDDLDIARIRIGGQRAPTQTRHVQRELEQYMEQKSLMAFVKLCRTFNLDPLNVFSLHVILILMSKHPDRLDVIQTFIAGLHEKWFGAKAEDTTSTVQPRDMPKATQ